MIKSTLSFNIIREWDSVTFKPLIQLAQNKIYLTKEKKYLWTFYLKDIKKVLEILSDGLEFSPEELKIVEELCPAKKEVIIKPSFKGEGHREFLEFPKIIRVLEKRKVENELTNEIEVEDIKHDCNKELISAIWEGVIIKQPINKPIKTGTVIKNIFEFLDIKVDSNKPRCLRDTKNYNRFYNPIMHILQNKGLIIYHKYGAIERISDGPLTYQTQFSEINDNTTGE